MSLLTWSLGQGVAINEDGSVADSTAMLDVQSTTKGLLIPRMTTAERLAIAGPATGLMVFDNTTLTFWYYDGGQWTEIGASQQSPFEVQNYVVRPNTSIVNLGSDDFVFGSTELDGDERRFFFDKSKGAFRAGWPAHDSDVWDDNNRGDYSVAFGYDTKASGDAAVAFVRSSQATGEYSTAFGRFS